MTKGGLMHVRAPLQIRKKSILSDNRGVPHGVVVKWFTGIPGVLGWRVFRGSVLGQDGSESQPDTSETQEGRE